MYFNVFSVLWLIVKCAMLYSANYFCITLSLNTRTAFTLALFVQSYHIKIPQNCGKKWRLLITWNLCVCFFVFYLQVSGRFCTSFWRIINWSIIADWVGSLVRCINMKMVSLLGFILKEIQRRKHLTDRK